MWKYMVSTWMFFFSTPHSRCDSKQTRQLGGRYRPHASKSPDAPRVQLQSQETLGRAACVTLRGVTVGKTLGWYTFLDLQNSPTVGAWTRSRCARLWSRKWALSQEAEGGKDLTPTTARKIVRTTVCSSRERKPAWGRAPGMTTQRFYYTAIANYCVLWWRYCTEYIKKYWTNSLQRSFYSFETSELHSGNDADALMHNTTALQQNKVNKKGKKEGDGDTVRHTSKKTSSNKILLSRELNGKLLSWLSACLPFEFLIHCYY